MPHCIHVEGPDGSGKSTLASQLSEALGLKLIPSTEGPPTTPANSFNRIDDRTEPGVIADRSSGLVSELVYGPVLRGVCHPSEQTLWRIIDMFLDKIQFIYCRPSLETIQKSHIPREEETPEHILQVEQKLEQIVSKYDEVMVDIERHYEGLDGTVIYYDWEDGSLKELAERCAESLQY